MQPHQFNPRAGQRSGGGCGRALLIGAGCLVILLVFAVGAVVAAGVIWDRGSEPAIRWAFEGSVEGSSDVSSRVAEADISDLDLPEPRSFDSRDEYLATGREFTEEMGRTLNEIGRLLASPQLQDDDWNDELARQIARLHHIRDQAGLIEPPEGLEDAHRHWVDGVDGVAEAMDAVADGLDELSPSRIIDALRSVERATESYWLMTRSLEEAEQE